jgi:hypothetical protein
MMAQDREKSAQESSERSRGSRPQSRNTKGVPLHKHEIVEGAGHREDRKQCEDDQESRSL